jgi:hypothetical protein
VAAWFLLPPYASNNVYNASSAVSTDSPDSHPPSALVSSNQSSSQHRDASPTPSSNPLDFPSAGLLQGFASSIQSAATSINFASTFPQEVLAVVALSALGISLNASALQQLLGPQANDSSVNPPFDPNVTRQAVDETVEKMTDPASQPNLPPVSPSSRESIANDGTVNPPSNPSTPAQTVYETVEKMSNPASQPSSPPAPPSSHDSVHRRVEIPEPEPDLQGIRQPQTPPNSRPETLPITALTPSAASPTTLLTMLDVEMSPTAPPSELPSSPALSELMDVDDLQSLRIIDQDPKLFTDSDSDSDSIDKALGDLISPSVHSRCTSSMHTSPSGSLRASETPTTSLELEAPDSSTSATKDSPKSHGDQSVPEIASAPAPPSPPRKKPTRPRKPVLRSASKRPVPSSDDEDSGKDVDVKAPPAKKPRKERLNHNIPVGGKHLKAADLSQVGNTPDTAIVLHQIDVSSLLLHDDGGLPVLALSLG